MKIGQLEKLLKELNALRVFKENNTLMQTSGMLEEEIDDRIEEIENMEVHIKRRRNVTDTMHTPLG